MEFKHLSSTDEIRITMIPYDLDDPIHEAVTKEKSLLLIGFVENGMFYAVHDGVVSDGNTDSEYVRLLGYRRTPYLVIDTNPSNLNDYFKHILHYTQKMHVYNWETWHWHGRTQIAIVTDWERY